MLLKCLMSTLSVIACCAAIANAQVDTPGQEYPEPQSYSLPIPIMLAEGGTAESETPKPPVRKKEVVPSPAATTIPTAASPDSLLLPPRPVAEEAAAVKSAQGSLGNPVRMLSSLAVVLGGFFLFAWVVRRNRLPAVEEEQVFRTMGRVSLLGKQAHVVKFGDRLLVLAKTANGLEKLTELTNPQEIERVVGLCHGGSSVQVARSVREMLNSEAAASF